MLNRRTFTRQVSALAIGSGFSPWTLTSEPLTFGLIADPHADLMPDHMQRLERFMESVDEKKPEFILQLGDFCFPKKENRAFLKLWQQFAGPRFHVLGNHDMDTSSKAVTMDFLGMPDRFYSYDIGGLHLVILDANNLCFADGRYEPYEKANFYIDDQHRTFVDPEQLAWLQEDLASTNNNILVFSHQSLCNPCWGIKNRLAVQKILEARNNSGQMGKVLACFNGHDHLDYHRKINNIHYLEINSMAYQWLGATFSDRSRYPKALYNEYPSLDKMAPYQDPLFAFVTVDAFQKRISVEGIISDWISPSPYELGAQRQIEGCQSTAFIGSRILPFDD